MFFFGNSNQQNSSKFPNTCTFDEEIYLLQEFKTCNNFSTIIEAIELECLKRAYSCFLRPFITKVFPYRFVSDSGKGD